MSTVVSFSINKQNRRKRVLEYLERQVEKYPVDQFPAKRKYTLDQIAILYTRLAGSRNG